MTVLTASLTAGSGPLAWVASTGGPQSHLSWNLVQDVRQVLEFPFMVNAFRAGTIVAVLAALMGWFIVLRRQTFAGHTLAVVGFPGAAGAVLVGVSATYGLFAFAFAAALLISLVPGGSNRSYSQESAVTGTVQAFALAAGFLFANLYGGFLGGINAALLFGSFLGITAQEVTILLAVAIVALLVLAAVARPLLFASLDPQVAAARGIPVRALSPLFLILLAAAAAEVSLITGTLLVFALLVIPAATAQNITPRPALSALIGVTLAVLVTWASLFIAYFSPYPIGFYLTSLAFACYVVTAGWQARPRLPRVRRSRRDEATKPEAARAGATAPAATSTVGTSTVAITP
jgi:zinc/manganese transport system permease protein